jgi:hypothetical protein
MAGAGLALTLTTIGAIGRDPHARRVSSLTVLGAVCIYVLIG